MSDLTVRILQGIREDLKEVRDEVRALRSEHGGILREHGALLHAHSAELREIRVTVKDIAAYKERDTMLLANELGDVKRRLGVCEDRLGITKP